MNICTWNCLGPHHNSDEETKNWIENTRWLKRNFPADLYVIQECSKLQVDKVRDAADGWKYAAWYGDDVDWFMRGTAIFSDNRYFTKREEFFHNPNFRYIVPYHIHADNLDFILYNVWTKAKPQNPEYKHEAYYFYENNVKEALKFYKETGHLEDCILIGDFNFGKDFQTMDKSFGLFAKEYGFETPCIDHKLKTYFANSGSSYFNDICFGKNLSVSLISQGTANDIENRSDHIPLVFEVIKKE